MASKVPVWGIDVGQCSLKAIKLGAAGDGVELLGLDVVEHDAILSEADADSTTMIHKAIETFAGRNNLKGCRIVVSVPGQQTLTRFTKMPPVEAKKIPDMVQYEASQQIPFDMDEVVWDYQVFTEKDSPDVEVGIFAIRKELIRNYLMNFTERGIEPALVQSSPMASYNAARFENPPSEAQALVILDMGALGTDLIIAEGNRIWSRPLPIGGNKFTEALVSAFKISFRKAEKLKRSAATSKYARQVFAAMRPIFADLVSEVQRSIGYYTSTHREAQVSRVLGMGNAFKLPGLQKFLQQNLQLEVDRLTGFKRMPAVEAAASPAFVENVMSFGVAYGLSLQGLGLAAINSNLLPLEVRRTLLWRKKRPWFAASAACLALAAGSIWIGNVSAWGELTKAKGNLQSISVPNVRDVAEAERILSGAGSDASIEYGARVAGAAKALQQAFAEADRARVGDMDMFGRMAKLTENDVFVPRLLDLVHRSVAAVEPPEVAQAKTLADYIQLAKQTPRAARREVWLDSMQMIFSGDASKIFPSEKKGSSGKPGWGLKLYCVTTEPQPAQWIENTLMPTMTKLGREPARGMYVDTVSLERVVKRGDLARLRSQGFSSQQQAAVVGRGGSERGVPPSVESSRDPTGRGAGAPRAVPAGGGGGGIGAEIARLRAKFEQQDPLTGEDTGPDQAFVLNVVVFKENTPPNLIPDEFKPKKPEPVKKP